MISNGTPKILSSEFICQLFAVGTIPKKLWPAPGNMMKTASKFIDYKTVMYYTVGVSK